MAENKLRIARIMSGKTQAQLSILSGVHYSTVSRIERGMVKPSKKQGQQLARALQVPADMLFPEEKEDAK